MEKAILVATSLVTERKENAFDSMKELSDLTQTCQIEIIDKVIQVRQKIHPKFYIGQGKLEELKEEVEKYQVDTIIFDDDLSPVQVRNTENILGCKVIGRTELILDIFANRARTKAAKLQVEYAQLSYLLPRLRRRWTHLSRIEGGIGFRGPGETQLEIDRRAIKRRIFMIKKMLKKISTQFATKRKNRMTEKVVCLVGYTNAGKSSLMNYLSKAEVFVDNALFATLDSTVRKTFISTGLSVLLIDTVGFIKKLPHHLIESFKSTLEEVSTADLLLHVVDVYDEGIEERISAVNSVLQELNTSHTDTVYVFNKIDLFSDEEIPFHLANQYDQTCFISTKTGWGIDNLKSLIEKKLADNPSPSTPPGR